ncbi:MAG: translation elongation factor Ts [Cytophagales bacterium]|nr:translation elongation factor Ts [Cytophagales bacterium]
MAITAKEVDKLRKMTGLGIMDCKKALVQSEGDFEQAIEILQKKGEKITVGREDRETNEGVVFAKVNAGGTRGVLVAFSCETDFVAKNEDFLSLGQEIVEVAFSVTPVDIDALKAVPIAGRTIAEKIVEATGKIGEKLSISAMELLEGEAVVPYIHSNKKLGVLVGLKHANGAEVSEAGKDVAMQIASMNPISVDKGDVDASLVEKEIEIGKEQARQEGKPEQIIEKIAQGKLQKFFKENTLLNQAFVKDSSMNVTQYLDSVSKGLTVSAFKRVQIG